MIHPAGKATVLGRAWTEPSRNLLWFNWTCSGFLCRFSGRTLRTRLTGVSGTLFGVEKPWLAVLADGELRTRFPLEEGEQEVTLFESDTAGEHTICCLKLSEAQRGQSAISFLETDGFFLDAPSEKKPLLEFVGDSITCGYGNEAQSRDDHFKPEEENGWETYAMRAARELNASWQCVSVSGISVALDPQGFSFPGMECMEALYPFTDAIGQERQSIQSPEAWDFAAHPTDAVILNLGTNDVNAYKMAKDLDKARVFFHAHYRAFIETLRRCNPKAFILCTLGPLDYYLYDEIRDIVATYQRDTGDERIRCFKFGAVRQWSEGYGADGHPSLKTHERMGHELASQLKDILK